MFPYAGIICDRKGRGKMAFIVLRHKMEDGESTKGGEVEKLLIYSLLSRT